jgi:hypothetical protein
MVIKSVELIKLLATNYYFIIIVLNFILLINIDIYLFLSEYFF